MPNLTFPDPDFMEPEARAFWGFSLAWYDRPGIAACCLGLQDQAGLDVNLLLFGLYLGFARGEILDAAEWDRLGAMLRPWSGRAISTLRRLRRQLKALDPAFGDFSTVIPVILAHELRAEAQAQAILVGLAREGQGTEPGLVPASLNLVRVGGRAVLPLIRLVAAHGAAGAGLIHPNG